MSLQCEGNSTPMMALLTDFRDSEVSRLEAECKELAQKWQIFQSVLPYNDRELPIESCPSISTVLEGTKAAREMWEEKKKVGFRRAKAHFISFCSKLNDHSFLFDIFPSGDKYTSLFSGVISSIVKVSYALPKRSARNAIFYSRHQLPMSRLQKASLKPWMRSAMN
jgi:hypothetical protein